ncbi:hypothetical protein Q8A73_020864 [Channa argus]|nr:hypothetical protein Q8A73_020864 [Channa argus]
MPGQPVSAPQRRAPACCRTARRRAVCMYVCVCMCVRAPGERLPLKRRHRCPHSGKKNPLIWFLFDRSHVCVITPRPEATLGPQSIGIRRLIFIFAWVGAVGPLCATRIEMSRTRMGNVISNPACEHRSLFAVSVSIDPHRPQTRRNVLAAAALWEQSPPLVLSSLPAKANMSPSPSGAGPAFSTNPPQ